MQTFGPFFGYRTPDCWGIVLRAMDLVRVYGCISVLYAAHPLPGTALDSVNVDSVFHLSHPLQASCTVVFWCSHPPPRTKSILLVIGPFPSPSNWHLSSLDVHCTWGVVGMVRLVRVAVAVLSAVSSGVLSRISAPKVSSACSSWL